MLMLLERLEAVEDECQLLRRQNRDLKHLKEQLCPYLPRGVHVPIPQGRPVNAVLLRMYLKSILDADGVVFYFRSRGLPYLCRVAYLSMTSLSDQEFPPLGCPTVSQIELMIMTSFSTPHNPYHFVRNLHASLEHHFYRNVPTHLTCYNIPKRNIQLAVAVKMNSEYTFWSSNTYYKLDELDLAVIKPHRIMELYIGKVEHDIYNDTFKQMVYTDLYGEYPNVVKIDPLEDEAAKVALLELVNKLNSNAVSSKHLDDNEIEERTYMYRPNKPNK